MAVVAEVCSDRLLVRLRDASPTKLHDDAYWRTDGNSPVIVNESRALAFFSHYLPIGHTLRRVSTPGYEFTQASTPIRLENDPAPSVGKWIEGIWRDPASGKLHGWYHAEEPTAQRGLFLPHIGEVESCDDGQTWRCRGELLRAPATEADCSWQNGAIAGGYGDLCVVADREGRYLYLAFSSYRVDERAQGICFARMPRFRGGSPTAGLELWTEAGWRPSAGATPKSPWPFERGLRHADPRGFWGPAIHYNRSLGAYVMLMARTAGGRGDWQTEGLYVSCNPDLADPAGWSRALRLVEGGAWYPQVIAWEDGCGDTEAGGTARFFMAGFSAWMVEFSRPAGDQRRDFPLKPVAADFERQFGPGKSPW